MTETWPSYVWTLVNSCGTWEVSITSSFSKLPCRSQIILLKTQELIFSSSNAALLFPWTFSTTEEALTLPCPASGYFPVACFRAHWFSPALRFILLMLPSIALLNLLSVFFSSRISVCLFVQGFYILVSISQSNWNFILLKLLFDVSLLLTAIPCIASYVLW